MKKYKSKFKEDTEKYSAVYKDSLGNEETLSFIPNDDDLYKSKIILFGTKTRIPFALSNVLFNSYYQQNGSSAKERAFREDIIDNYIVSTMPESDDYDKVEPFDLAKTLTNLTKLQWKNSR